MTSERLRAITCDMNTRPNVTITDRYHARELLAEVKRLREGIEALHRPVHFVFSWSGGLRHEDPCPECNGKAGVHPCGCWADEDMSYECLGCSLHDKDDRRVAPWPCPTAALLDPPTEGEADHE